MARPKKNLYDNVDPFAEENSAQAVTDDIFGAPRVDGLGGKRTVARDIRLDKIWLDPTQPRRTIPMSMRKDWDGDPSKVETLLSSWSQDVKMWLKQGESLSWHKILRGEDFINVDKESSPPLMQTFIGLIELALSIRDAGLNNPITVSKDDKRFILHTGERRLIATHMLKIALGDEYKAIQAIERDFDVWTQIEENTQREQMNAISMARSLAKLIMDMYKDEMEFKPYSAMVTKAGCDRPYYAQAVELNIKYGLSDRVLTALNTTSKSYIRNYRNILNLHDDVWMIADQESWTEGRIRHILQMPHEMQPQSVNWTTGRIEEWLDEQKRCTPVHHLDNDQGQGDDNNQPARTSADDVIASGEYRKFERQGFNYGATVVIEEESQVYRWSGQGLAQGLFPTGQVIINESGKYQETYEFEDGRRFDMLYLFTGQSVIIDAGCIRLDSAKQPQTAWTGETPHNKGRDWYAGAAIITTHVARPLDIDRGRVITIWGTTAIPANSTGLYKRSIKLNGEVFDFIEIDGKTVMLDSQIVALTTSTQINAHDSVHSAVDPRASAPRQAPANEPKGLDKQHSANPSIPDDVIDSMSFLGRKLPHQLRDVMTTMMTIDEHGLQQWIDEDGSDVVYKQIKAFSEGLATSAASMLDDINKHLIDLWKSVVND